ncbi:MAG: HIT domain-containing protein [Opitutaceae bacterium]|nr:HIT domain-containing protein [Opitutaceae bacterium]
MQHLHAYWRMEYIEAPKGETFGNPFAEMPRRGDDKATHILVRSRHAYIVLNRFPYNAGHLLVVPYREVAELADLTAEERVDFMDTLIAGQDILRRALRPDGFNIGFNLGAAAGAGIPRHLHAHIVPRWNGDTNFMPVLGQTRVLPQSLDAMWARLREFCAPTAAPAPTSAPLA